MMPNNSLTVSKILAGGRKFPLLYPFDAHRLPGHDNARKAAPRTPEEKAARDARRKKNQRAKAQRKINRKRG